MTTCDLYIKMLSTLSGVKLIFEMSPYLNIRGISLEKRYCAEKSDHVWQFVTRVYDNAERWSICQTVQYSVHISGVILMSCILSPLNILCNNVIKPAVKWRLTRYSPFTCYDYFTRSPTYWIWSERSNPYIKTFITLSGERTVFLITTIRHSLHKCSETILWLKRQFTVQVSSVSCALKFTEARKTCHRVVRTSFWSILYSGELCNKNCIVKTSEMLIV